MPIAKVATSTFSNQVRTDYSSAYFRRKLFWAALGRKIMKNFTQTPGNKVDLVFYLKMGAAQKPGEDDRLDVDSFGDKSVSAQIYEIGKAAGITDAGRYRHGNTIDGWENECASQMGQRVAEAVDTDALACLNNDGNSSIDGATGNDPKGHDAVDKTSDITLTTTFSGEKGADTAPFKAQLCNINDLHIKIADIFGDLRKQANLMAMHSTCFADAIGNNENGILKADAVSPIGSLQDDFSGNILGRSVFENDTCPQGPKRTVTDSAGSTQKYETRKVFILKPNSFVVVVKQSPKIEDARDVLGRIDYKAMTQWLTFYPLHKINNDEDVRAGGVTYLTRIQTT